MFEEWIAHLDVEFVCGTGRGR